MFQVTDANASIVVLRGWLNHFHAVGRPAGIVVYKGALSVWRDGAARGRDRGRTEFWVESPRGRVMESVHGFDRLWEKELKKKR